MIRGVSSINGGKPLYILDGVPITANNFQKLQPNQIKNISVLKDESATALYWARAKNGVVIINTKAGNGNEIINDSYQEIIENQFQVTEALPLSTFSMDVDKASYSNIRRMINMGQSIPVSRCCKDRGDG